MDTKDRCSIPIHGDILRSHFASPLSGVGHTYPTAFSLHKSILLHERSFLLTKSIYFVGNIVIRGPGKLGYAAFLSDKATPIEEGTPMGEYLGELYPEDSNLTSLYRFGMKGGFSIDAQDAGNWTRFANSHCDPNVEANIFHVGKLRFILFSARRTINPGDEININYKKDYFVHAGFKCKCDGYMGPHWPGQWKGQTRSMAAEEEALKAEEGAMKAKEKVQEGKEEVSTTWTSFSFPLLGILP